MIVYNNMINKNIAIFIDNLTEKIIDVYNIKIPIMNMKEVLKSIGGKIVYKNNYYELIDGNIIKTHDRKFDILLPILNKNSNNNFTIAYNLGHIFLHMGYSIEPIFYYGIKLLLINNINLYLQDKRNRVNILRYLCSCLKIYF